MRAPLLAALLFGLLLPACGSDETADQETTAGAERASFVFTGTVERVDSASRTVTVRNDDVPGWMSAMSMSYSVDRPEVLDQLTVGARVRATVYAGDFATLYGAALEPQ